MQAARRRAWIADALRARKNLADESRSFRIAADVEVQ
jgi:hypothetical protein